MRMATTSKVTLALHASTAIFEVSEISVSVGFTLGSDFAPLTKCGYFFKTSCIVFGAQSLNMNKSLNMNSPNGTQVKGMMISETSKAIVINGLLDSFGQTEGIL